MSIKCAISRGISGLLLLVALSSCSKVFMMYMGIKKPRPKTDEQVKAFVNEQHLDYDYFVRPKDDSALFRMQKKMKIGLNNIVMYDNSGNEIGNTNDSTCHYSLRSQITALLKSDNYVKTLAPKNIKEEFDQDIRCLYCKTNAPLFSQDLKQYVLFFTVSTFIPIREKLSDLDYVQELKQMGLRDKVSVVLISGDVH